MNGLTYIAGKFHVSEMWENGDDTELDPYRDLKGVVKEKNIPCRIMEARKSAERIGEATIRVLHPARGFPEFSKKAYVNENNRSLVLRIELGRNVVLFPGDIEAGAEARLVQEFGQNLKCDLLKVPHHGSKSSSAENFVSIVRPAIAVVTVGKGNPYRQPSEDVIARYKKNGTRVYRTDRDGAIIVTGKKDKLRVQSWAEMVMKRITIGDPSSWAAQERENWQRAGKRMFGYL
jgi:competence protein ComEC